MKNKLQDQLGINFAYKECVVHSQLNHDNVVKLHEYTESDDQFVLFMEYCNDAAYFEDKIIEVSTSLPTKVRSQLLHTFWLSLSRPACLCNNLGSCCWTIESLLKWCKILSLVQN